MIRPPIKWGATHRRLVALNRPPDPPPPEFVGDWNWRTIRPHESIPDWRTRCDAIVRQITAGARNWLVRGQPVRLLRDHDPLKHIIAGRVGMVERMCSGPFSDYAYVRFPPIGRQTVVRIEFIPLEAIEPTEQRP